MLATLVTAFGVGHVVGGGYHPGRDSLFLVQDNVPGGTNANRVAEVDSVSGAVLGSFQVSAAGYSVSYGDLDIALSGNLLLVSSIETTLAEFTPSGGYVQELALPSGVSSLCGLATDGTDLEGWVAGSGGPVWRLGGLPSCGAETYCTAGTTALGCTALLGSTRHAERLAPLRLRRHHGRRRGPDQRPLLLRHERSPGESVGQRHELPVRRAAGDPHARSSSGTPDQCDGTFAFDFNTHWNVTKPQTNPGAGAKAKIQTWFRDPFNTSNQTTSLSDGSYLRGLPVSG